MNETPSQHRCFIVTGGAGFIGSSLCARLSLLYPGAHIVVVDDFSSGTFDNLVSAHERIGAGAFRGEVVAMTSAEVEWAWLITETRPEAIFHLGAQTDTTIDDERAMIERNVNGFSEMLDVAHQASVPLVYASSAATYGSPEAAESRRAFTEPEAGQPNNVYGFSKWLMECEHRRFAERIRAQEGAAPMAVGLRYFNVFGPGEARKGRMASMVYQLAGQLLEGERPRLFRDGQQARDQVHVDDVVACTLAGAGIDAQSGERRAPTPGVYNCGSGQATAFDEIARTLRGSLGLADGQQEVEYFDMPPHVRAFYQDFTLADMTSTTAALHWSPSIEPREGIASYARWLAERASARGASGAARATAGAN